MAFERQVIFWVVAFAMFVAFVWLLGDVLLPFVAGMGLAYLLDPAARRAEELGIGRGISALIILTLVVVVLVVTVMAAAPVVAQQFTAFADGLPGYISKLQTLITDPSR